MEGIVDKHLRNVKLLRKETVEDLLNLLLYHDPETFRDWIRRNAQVLKELSDAPVSGVAPQAEGKHHR